MAGQTTLIVTTRSGVRPLGVRGEPLHNAAPQLRRVVRRRLGDDAAGLLADPQAHEDGKAIDWYADWPGQVQPLSALAPEKRAEVLAGVERTLAEIRRLGDALAGAGPREDMGVVGLSLQLAARAPAQSFIFLVGERPVIVCWGYEKEAAASLLPSTLPRPPEPAPLSPAGRRPVLEAPAVAALPVARPVSTTIPWLRTLLLALPLMLLLLGAAWLLREMLPADPSLSLATREGPPAPPAAEPPPDPTPALKAAFSTEQSRERILKVELSLVEAELKKRIADCKPPEQPKPPPQVAVAPPPPKPAPAPAPAPTPAPRQTRPNDDRLRLPRADQRLLLHVGLLAHRSVPPRADAGPARRVVLLLRRQRQRPARMAARPHRLPHPGAGALRGPDVAHPRRRFVVQRRLALVRRPARLPARRRQRRAMQRPLAGRLGPVDLDGQPAQAELSRSP